MNHLFRAAFLSLLGVPLQAQNLRTVRITNQIPRPTNLCSPPGDFERLLVLESRRGVRIIKNGVLLATPFLDLSSDLGTNEGLVGMAFHPQYSSNGRFFLSYLDKDLDNHLVEYKVSSDPDLADPTTRTEILTPVHNPSLVHNWNCLQFGLDGMLYVGLGDATSTDDYSVSNSQDLSSLLGKILRLDVDLPPPYVPPDNPLVGDPGVREEIWAWGLRNPWRFHFDAATGDLYIGDVGRVDWEELDFLPSSVNFGANFGWRCVEGTQCRDYPTCTPCTDPRLLPPIHQYDHGQGDCAIIGGPVYRGQAIPGLEGTYFFADFCSGRFWSLRYDGQTIHELQERTEELAPWDGGSIALPTSFGVDAAGELYILDNQGDEVFQVIAASCSTESYCQAAPNSAGPGATIGSTGSTSISADEFRLTVTGAPPGQTGLFFYGRDPLSAPFGDGYLCVAARHFRLMPPVHFDAQGMATRPIDFHEEARILPGTSWRFQCWYRDPAFGGAGFNATDALLAGFCP